MKFDKLIETIRKIDTPILEAATPKSPEMKALLKQRAALKKQLVAIEHQILDQERQESLAARQQVKVPNADKTLSVLWRQYFDAMVDSEDEREDSPEWRKLDRLMRNVHSKVTKAYGAQMANHMLTHTDMLMRPGRKASHAARQYRAQHGVSDEYFDPASDLID